MALLSIIIVSYNSRKVLLACLESLEAHGDRDRDEVIVVDNDSNDGTAQVVRETFPWVRLVSSGANLGFGRACNLGAKLASADTLFFLNPDTEWLDDAGGRALYFLETHRSFPIGVAGFPMVDASLQPTTSAGAFPTLSSIVIELTPGTWRTPRLRCVRRETFVEVDYVSGAAMIVPKSVFNEMEGFDPDFFLFFEETELQKRMAQRGYLRVILNGGPVMHHVGNLSHLSSHAEIRRFEKSRILYYRKIYGKMGEVVCRLALSTFYASRAVLGGPAYYRQAAAEVWHV